MQTVCSVCFFFFSCSECALMSLMLRVCIKKQTTSCYRAWAPSNGQKINQSRSSVVQYKEHLWSAADDRLARHCILWVDAAGHVRLLQLAQCITNLKQWRYVIWYMLKEVQCWQKCPCSVLKCCRSIVVFLMFPSAIIIPIITTKQYNSLTVSNPASVTM